MMKMWKNLDDLRYKIAMFGTFGETDFREIRATIVLNSVTISAISIILFFVFYYVLTNNYKLLVTTLAPLTVFLLVYHLNAAGYNKAARILMLTISNFSLVLAGYMVGYKCGFHFFYFSLISVVFVLFPNKNFLLKIFLSMLPISLGLVQKYFSDSIFSGVEELNPSFIKTTYYFSVMFSGIIIGLVSYSFAVTVDTYHLMLMKDEERRVESSRFESLAVLSAGVAHEINNPLAVIASRANQINTLHRNGKLDSKNIEAIVENIEKHTKRISKIISGLRAFSRNTENDPLERASLKYILDECVELFPPAIKTKSVEFYIEEFKDLQIFCRPGQLMQVIVNIINNACDAIELQESPWIHISVSYKGSYAIIRIVDSGYGIDPQIADKIMQPFFTTKDVGKGTGLGLSVSVTIMEKQGGKLVLDSQSKNTCFVLYIRLIE